MRAANSSPGHERHVFIIEDNELLVRLYRTIFGAMGLGVVHASCKDDARHIFKRTQPDLFIIDDDRGTAIEMTREIRACRGLACVPIIATVLPSSRELTGRLEMAGISSVVTKPLQLNAFSALARKHLAPGQRAAARVLPVHEAA